MDIDANLVRALIVISNMVPGGYKDGGWKKCTKIHFRKEEWVPHNVTPSPGYQF